TVLAREGEYRDEADNITAARLPVILSPAADLRVTALGIPERAVSGQSFELTYAVTNAGAAATPALQPAWDDLYYLSRDALPDLQVDDIAIPLTGRAGDPVTVTWAVSNHGDFPAAGAWSDTAYLSEDAVWDVGDRPLGRVAFSGKLEPGQAYTSTLTTALPPV